MTNSDRPHNEQFQVDKPDGKSRSFIKAEYHKSSNDRLIKLLNKVLSNYYIHGQKLRSFTWNIVGENTFELRKQFEQQYNYARIATDELAQRIRVFEQRPLSTYHQYLKASMINENESLRSPKEMIDELLDDYKILLLSMFDLLDVATHQGDSTTEELMREFIEYTEKSLWKMRSLTIGQN